MALVPSSHFAATAISCHTKFASSTAIHHSDYLLFPPIRSNLSAQINEIRLNCTDWHIIWLL